VVFHRQGPAQGKGYPQELHSPGEVPTAPCSQAMETEGAGPVLRWLAGLPPAWCEGAMRRWAGTWTRGAGERAPIPRLMLLPIGVKAGVSVVRVLTKPVRNVCLCVVAKCIPNARWPHFTLACAHAHTLIHTHVRAHTWLAEGLVIALNPAYSFTYRHERLCDFFPKLHVCVST
jgi:hypothetical protein